MNPRIKGLLDLFPRDSVLVDIGSDHGYLGIELLKLEKISCVINVDLSKDALRRSMKYYEKEKLLCKAKFYVSDGFEKISNLYDNSVVVIAGLGTHHILKILRRMPSNIKKLLLLSHTDYYQIRKWAFSNGWWILHEKYVRDKKSGVYLIIYLIKTEKKAIFNMRDLIFGREEFWKIHLDFFIDYWKPRVERIKKIPFKYREEVETDILKFFSESKIIS